MLTHCRTFAFVVAAAVLFGAPAFGQDAQSTAEFESWQLPGWTVTPGVVLGGLYDSNVALGSPAAGATKTASDRLFELEPYGQVEYNSARTRFFSGYHGFIRNYTTYDALNSVEHRAYMSLRELLTRRVTIYASDTFLSVPTTDELQLNDVPFQRTGARYDTFTGGVQAHLTRTTDFSSEYDLTWVDFAHQGVILSGGTINGIQSDLVHYLSDRVGVGGEYDFRWANLNANAQLLAFQQTGAVLRYVAGPNTTLEFVGGISHLSDFQQNLGRTGPFVRADLTQHARRATYGAHYELEYTPSLAFAASDEAQEASGYIQMPITRKHLYVEANAAWRSANPVLVGQLPLGSMWIGGTGGYAIERWIRLEVYDEYTRQDTHLAGGQINRSVIGFQIVLAHPVRIR